MKIGFRLADLCWEILTCNRDARSFIDRRRSSVGSSAGAFQSLFAIVALTVLSMSVAGASEAVDNFNRANGGLGANWTVTANSSSALQIASNQVQEPVSNYGESVYTGAAFGGNQFSELQYSSGLTNAVINLTVRTRQYQTSGTQDGYIGQLNGFDSSWKIIRLDNQVETVIATGALTYANGDMFYFEANGSSLTLKKNGVTLGTTTDATYTTGDTGFGIYNAASLLVDNWRGSDDLPATDNFNRANGGLGASWTVTANSSSALQIASNQVQEPVSNYGESVYSGAAFGGNQFSELQYSSGLSNAVINLTVRTRQYQTSGAQDGYIGQLNGFDSSWKIIRLDNEVETVIASGALTYAGGDTFYFEASGSSLTLKKNGVTIGTTTDATYTTGDTGFGIYNAASLLVDNWRSGELTGSSPPSASTGKIIFRFPKNQTQWDQARRSPIGSYVFPFYSADPGWQNFSNPDSLIAANIAAAQAAGVRVIGFIFGQDVSTGTALPRSTIKGWIDQWYATFPTLDGIYLGAAGWSGSSGDGMTFTNYWADIATYVRSKGGKVILNMGTVDTSIVPNSTEQNLRPLLENNYVDVLGVFEGRLDYSNGASQLPSLPLWVTNGSIDGSRLCMFANQQTWLSAQEALADLPSIKNYYLSRAGFIFISHIDNRDDPSLYDSNTYWDLEIAGL